MTAKTFSTSSASTTRGGMLFEGAEWDFETVRRVYEAIETIARDDLGLDVYPNQIEIISASRCSTPIPRSACR